MGALLSWLTTADIHPLVVALGAAIIPVVVNLLNPADIRMGVGKQPRPEDIATMHEFEIEGE